MLFSSASPGSNRAGGSRGSGGRVDEGVEGGAAAVAPALGGLDWARATVPSPHGFITVEAHTDGTVEVDSPVPVVHP